MMNKSKIVKNKRGGKSPLKQSASPKHNIDLFELAQKKGLSPVDYCNYKAGKIGMCYTKNKEHSNEYVPIQNTQEFNGFLERLPNTKHKDISNHQLDELKTCNLYNLHCSSQKWFHTLLKRNSNPVNAFKVQNVNPDGACFFRAFANVLYYKKNVSVNRDDMFTKSEKAKHGKKGIMQSKIATKLRNEAIEWILENWDKPIKKFTNIKSSEKVSDWILTEHGMSDQKIYRKYMLKPTTWGGSIEQIALSNLYKLPIVIYEAYYINEDGKKQNFQNLISIKGNWDLYEKILNNRDILLKSGKINNLQFLEFEISNLVGSWFIARGVQPIHLLRCNFTHYFAMYPDKTLIFNRRGKVAN